MIGPTQLRDVNSKKQTFFLKRRYFSETFIKKKQQACLTHSSG